ncbi:MAG: hypothetical protein IID05_00005 [Gemmatimonadetes bacterium]|nr:hypothetical protein [Gemmatimonadota bacterium]
MPFPLIDPACAMLSILPFDLPHLVVDLHVGAGDVGSCQLGGGVREAVDELVSGSGVGIPPP